MKTAADEEAFSLHGPPPRKPMLTAWGWCSIWVVICMGALLAFELMTKGVAR